MRPIPATSLGPAHGLLRAIDQRGRLRTDEFVTEFSIEELFPPDLENALGRLRHFVSYARAAGLVKEDRGVVELTDVGRRYIRAGEADRPFEITPNQAEWLRRQLREKHMTDSIYHGLAIGLSLLASTPPGMRVSTLDFGRSMAYLGRAGWDNENTLEIQGERHLLLLQDMEMLDAEHRLTPTGEQVRGELTLPVHMSLIDIAGQLNPGGPDAVRAAAEAEWAPPPEPEPEPAPLPPQLPEPAATPESEEEDDFGYETVGGMRAVDSEPAAQEQAPPPIVPRTDTGEVQPGRQEPSGPQVAYPPLVEGSPPPQYADAPPAGQGPHVEPSGPTAGDAHAGAGHDAPPPDPETSVPQVRPPAAPPVSYSPSLAAPQSAPVGPPQPAAPRGPIPGDPLGGSAPSSFAPAESPPVTPGGPVAGGPPAAPPGGHPPYVESPPAPPPGAPGGPPAVAPPQGAPPVVHPPQEATVVTPLRQASAAPQPQPSVAFLDAAAIRAAGEAAGLRLPGGDYANVAGALTTGRHLILTGAPGSGKTTLALAIARAAAQAGKAHGATVVTGAPGRPLLVESAASGRWVIADELNQADPDARLAALSTLLGGVPVTLDDGEVEPAQGWRMIATWNGPAPRARVLRRFAVVTLHSPTALELEKLLRQQDATVNDAVGKVLALGARVGAGVLLDAARHIAARQAASPTDASTLAEEAFAAYIAPLADTEP